MMTVFSTSAVGFQALYSFHHLAAVRIDREEEFKLGLSNLMTSLSIDSSIVGVLVALFCISSILQFVTYNFLKNRTHSPKPSLKIQTLTFIALSLVSFAGTLLSKINSENILSYISVLSAYLLLQFHFLRLNFVQWIAMTSIFGLATWICNIAVKQSAFEVYTMAGMAMSPAILGEHHEVRCARCRHTRIIRHVPSACECCVDIAINRRLEFKCELCGHENTIVATEGSVFFCPADRILVNKLLRPNRFDNVVYSERSLREEPDSKTILIRRVLGLPNEHIKIKDGQLYVDGVAQSTYPKWSLLNGVSEEYTLDDDTYLLATDSCWIMADKADKQGSMFGWPISVVRRKELIGVASYRIAPIHRFETLRSPNESSHFWLLNPQLAELDKRLAEVSAGDHPQGADELVALGQRSYQLRRYAQAMRFFDTALTQPGLQKQGIAYNAACCAALLASGEATDERTTDADGRANLRAKALEWLTIAISDGPAFPIS